MFTGGRRRWARWSRGARSLDGLRACDGFEIQHRCARRQVRRVISGVEQGGGIFLDQFLDGRDEAVGLVVDEFFDGARCGCGTCVPRWARLFGHEGDEDLQVVEQASGALVVEVVGGDAGEDLRGDGEGGGAVLDDGELEGLVGVEVAELADGRFGAAGGVVEVAELLVAQGGRPALVSGGVDVAALGAGLGYGGSVG